MKTEANDPIYPVQEWQPDESMSTGFKHTTSGSLTKREYFSALAMQGQVAHYGSASPEQVAKPSVKMADALIKELNTTSTEN